jgi:hypothetical protein
LKSYQGVIVYHGWAFIVAPESITQSPPCGRKVVGYFDKNNPFVKKSTE